MIWKKQIATASPRLQRLLLRLARYEIQLEYIRGKDNSIADALSIVDLLSTEPQDTKQVDRHFRCIRLLTPFQQQTIALTEPELPAL